MKLRWCWHDWRAVGETYKRPIPGTGCKHVHPIMETVYLAHCTKCCAEKVMRWESHL